MKLIFRFATICIVGTLFVYITADSLNVSSFPPGIDDSDIYLVYAKNLVEGYGFVYNPGGEHVEGFTSLLWTLIAAFSCYISKSPEYVLLFVNILLLSIVQTLLSFFVDENFSTKNKRLRFISLYSLIFLAVIFSSPRYLAWTTFTLMDIGLYSAVLISGVLILFRLRSPKQYLGLSIMSFLLLVTRPEGMLWGLFFLGIAWAKIFILFDLKPAIKIITIPFITYCLTLISLTAFRIFYFGYPLPNTYYAKVSPDIFFNIKEGIRYLTEYIVYSDAWVTLAVLCLFLHTIFLYLDFMHNAETVNRKQYLTENLDGIFLLIITWIGLLMPLISGGDHFGSHRFYQAIHPLLILNIFFFTDYLCRYMVSFSFLSSPKEGLKIWILAIISLLTPFLFQMDLWRHFDEKSHLQHEFHNAYNGRKRGSFMSSFFEKMSVYPTVGVVIAGGIKYMYEGSVFDLMGLNHTMMGHSKNDRKRYKNHAAFEKNIFFSNAPDIVIPEIVDIKRQPFRFRFQQLNNSWVNRKPLAGLFNDADFQKLYQYARISDKGISKGLQGFFSRDYLSKLKNYYTIEIAKPSL